MTKKALAAVSFGTTHRDARAAIEKLENALAARLPEYTVFRAFTSGMVSRRLAREQGLVVPAPDALLETLAREGFEDVIVQSLHVIAGEEYEKMRAQTSAFETRFRSLRIGKPLLWDDADIAACAGVLARELPPLEADEAAVFMGHGSRHPQNGAYTRLEVALRKAGAARAYIATVEAKPDFGELAERLRRGRIRRAYLLPLMIVAGEHIKHDLAGDGPDSWVSQLRARGVETETIPRGLGEYTGVAELFAQHAAADNG
jgi:sirohydrochlorin cobaltochelatase